MLAKKDINEFKNKVLADVYSTEEYTAVIFECNRNTIAQKVKDDNMYIFFIEDDIRTSATISYIMNFYLDMSVDAFRAVMITMPVTKQYCTHLLHCSPLFGSCFVQINSL